jgi:Animal haem peroxidase/Fibronectin type III domain/RTX calcium-binding nonapeptide repeat (4 copies)
MLGVPIIATEVAANAAPEGQGFTLNRSDLRFILNQIRIAEAHALSRTDENPCATLLGSGPNQIPNGNQQGVELPLGLRTVDGTCNNLIPGKEEFGAADTLFPRLVPGRFEDADFADPDGPGPADPVQTSYTQTSGTVVDAEPRVISNLIVDQTDTNPAAVAVSGADPATTVPGETLFIPNSAPDVGLSAPFNSVFTLFGQFFDHGLDLVTKGGGTIYMPLREDDPLYVPGGSTNFMVLTRATNQPGGVQEHTNTTTAFVDQNQTYTSHPSHQVFLREFVLDATLRPIETGHLIEGSAGGMATWADLKTQAADLLGIQLVDADVLNVPLLATDPYGNFTRGPSGFPQIVTGSGLVEGDPGANGGAGVLIPGDAVRTGHAFLDDIAHHAAPVGDRNPLDGPGPNELRDPDSDPGTTDDNDFATYDDEMLNAHFIAGDGRANENIGLTAIHQVFHSEHNRLVEDVKNVLLTEDPTMVPEWQNPDGSWDGDRLFQAARFVTEMEYQHLVFEEFARKVQPMVNLFGEGGTGYKTTIDPAIRAEFAHSVYRFGHSMLTETVARRNADGSNNDIALIEAFLNPPAYFDGGPAGALSPEQAAGSIMRGMSRQVGNQIDEFVTEALRNNLLGLPLDLATINMARGRDTGVPTLNRARRAFYAASNNSAVMPYESWADLSFGLRNPETLVNVVAAFGTHESITSAATVAGKRAAAQALLDLAEDGSLVEGAQEAFDFLNSIGVWANDADGVTITGVDDIDLWMGGLVEKPMVFGGMLGATFNYVFENQMEDLQNGDRFYYLSRTAGLNLLTQLEGNSFAELVMRNTDVSGLPADAFSRPDFTFDMAQLGTSGAVLDDPSTEWNESTLLTRMANGTIRFGGGEHVVFNGAPGNNRMWSSEGDDTLRGNDGNDWMQGGDGNDNLIGGLGDDTMLDLAGDDVLKGGRGNDALSSGQGFGGDLNQGGLGKDFVYAGNDMTETFAGAGDDFVFAGDAEGTVFGDDGDDWIEAGRGPFYLLQGDNGAPFQDDPNEPGHDVLDGDGGEQDYDAEGGDDIMLAGPGIQRAEGMLGFDYVTHKGDPLAADSDMDFTGLLPVNIETNRDRFDLVEALSGWNFDDILRGDSRAAADLGTTHQLNAAGIARINGLAAVLPPGTTSFNAGNIILGGTGSDLIEGRGGDDVIDGDSWLNVRLSVRTNAADPATEIGSADGMNKPYLAGSTRTLQQDVFAGRVNPGNIVIVREVLSTPNSGDIDTVQFTGALADYTITNVDGVLTVSHNGAGIDGTDTVRNAERLQFSDQTITLATPAAPIIGTATAGNTTASVSFTPPASAGGLPVTSFRIIATPSAGPAVTVTGIAPGATSGTVTGLTNGTAYSLQVQAVNALGAGALSAPSNLVTPSAPPAATAPAAPTGVTAVGGNTSATVNWVIPADGGSPITSFRIQVRTGTTVLRTINGVSPTATSFVVTALTNGTAYNFRVRAVNAVGLGPLSAASNVVTPAGATAPGQPAIGVAVSGIAGGPITATANWPEATNTGGSPITGYRIRALRLAADGTVLSTTSSPLLPASARTLEMTLPVNNANYRFTVQAFNAIGGSRQSVRSNLVIGR